MIIDAITTRLLLFLTSTVGRDVEIGLAGVLSRAAPGVGRAGDGRDTGGRVGVGVGRAWGVGDAAAAFPGTDSG
jgi:hypothetical protein